MMLEYIFFKDDLFLYWVSQLEVRCLFGYVKYVLHLIKYVCTGLEEITIFVVWYISLTFWCLNYMKNSCNVVYLFRSMLSCMCVKYVVM
jgi:hypothetical protein